MVSKLGLDKLPAKPKYNIGYLTPEEWAEVFAALDRGVSVADIYAKVGRYQSLKAFYNSIYNQGYRLHEMRKK